MKTNSSICVAGSSGMVGSAIMRGLQRHGFDRLITLDQVDCDLTDPVQTDKFFAQALPEYLLLAAARVGGILANSSQPVEFLEQNLLIQINVMRAAHKHGVTKLLFLGSSCIYPRLATQPIKEESLLTGPLEETNKSYALAKIAGIQGVQSYRDQFGADFIAAMPTNLYGPHDNFNLDSSHVLPAMIRKFHDAKLAGHTPVTIWGSGSPSREFLHVDDLADAAIFLMQNYSEQLPLNVGTGKDITIRELAELVQRVTGHEGDIIWDDSKPDGTPRKLLDVSRLTNLGWQSSIALEDGIRSTWQWFASNRDNFRG